MAHKVVGTNASLIFVLTLVILLSRDAPFAEAGQNCICECMKVCRSKFVGRDARCTKACSKACIKVGFPTYPKDGIIFCTPPPPNST